jgi:hypothetical protein
MVAFPQSECPHAVVNQRTNGLTGQAESNLLKLAKPTVETVKGTIRINRRFCILLTLFGTGERRMIKKIVFTVLWTWGALLAVGMVVGLAAPLFPKVSGTIDEHTPRSITYTYFAVAQIPIAVGLVFLLLGIFGKLPGTKRKVSK